MNGDRAFSDILQELFGNLQGLVRSEVRLAKAEIREDASHALSAGVWLGLGAVSGIAAAMLLLWAAVFALATRMPLWGAALVVCAVMALASVVLLLFGRRQWQLVHGIPDRTVESVKEDLQWIRQSTR
jgi:uncharacterized membrane protein YqjE